MMAGVRQLSDPFTFRDFLEFIDGDFGDMTYDAAKIIFDNIAARWYEPVAIEDDGSFLYQHREHEKRTIVFDVLPLPHRGDSPR